jgi:hypothetical protein
MTDLDKLTQQIKACIAAGDKFLGKADQHYAAAGRYLKTLKDSYTGTWIEWEKLLKTKIGIGKSRASELMQIADGTKTAKQVRNASAKRKAKEREKSLRDVTEKLSIDDEKPKTRANDAEASADARKAEYAALDSDQTKQPSRAEVAKLLRVWVKASAGAKRVFVRERWDEIVVARKQLEANGSDHEQDRWIEGDNL